MTLRTLQKTYRMSSKISGLSLSLSFILSFMAVIILLALSSAPCFELFSAAPEIRINMFHEFLPLKLNYFFYILKYLYFFFHSCTYFISVSNSTIFFYAGYAANDQLVNILLSYTFCRGRYFFSRLAEDFRRRRVKTGQFITLTVS